MRHHGDPDGTSSALSLRRLGPALVVFAAGGLAHTLTPPAHAQPVAYRTLSQVAAANRVDPPDGTQTPAPKNAEEAAQRAKLEFVKGNDAYEKGNYREAAEAFEQAHRLSPHSAVLFNAARAWWKMGESERAADNYAAAIARGELTSEQTLRARSALSNLRKKLGWIIVSGPSDAIVSIGHLHESSLPLTAHLTPGEHVLSVQHEGQTWEQIVTVQADAPLSVIAKKDRPAPARSAPPPPEEPVRTSNSQRNWGWFAVGMGGAFGAGSVVTGALTLRARDRFDQLNDGSPQNVSAAEAERREAKNLRSVTNVLAFTGGALALTGLTLVLTAPRPKRLRGSGETIVVAIGVDRLELRGAF